MKSLAIVYDQLDGVQLSLLRGNDIEVLALSAPAMLFLKNKGIDFRTPEEFYPVKDYRSEIDKLIPEVVKIFSEYDQSLARTLKFPHAFSGTLPYFLVLFSDVLFMEGLIRAIKRSAPPRIVFFGKALPEVKDWSCLEYADLKGSNPVGGLSMALTSGIYKKASLLKKGLDGEFVECGGRGDENKLSVRQLAVIATSVWYQIKQRIGYPTVIRRWILERIVRVVRPNFFPSPLSVSLLVQQGYDLRVLWQFCHLQKLKYRSIFHLRKQAAQLRPTVISNEESLLTLQSLIKSHFPIFGNLIIGLINSYQREVVGRVPIMLEKFRRLIKNLQPNRLILSIGTRDVFDVLFCFEGRRLDLPLIFFQHGGVATNFVSNPYAQFVERPIFFNTKLVVSSEAQREFLRQEKNSNTEIIALGSLRESIERKSKSIITTRQKKALYLTSPFASYNFRSLFTDDSDLNKMEINKSIFSAASEMNLCFDVKLHPVEEKEYEPYFNQLKNIYDTGNTKILVGGPAEAIVGRYDLIVIDYLPSYMVSLILRMKVPIICWIGPRVAVNEFFLNSLKKRCYFIEKKSELVEKFQEFQAGALPSKYTDESSNYFGGVNGKESGYRMSTWLDKTTFEFHGKV
ncbi:hypothetical protein OAV24_00045 [Gammaproteobacteria bacterium]|nr:hypothetical protein [Gammaproteobacteria bacterium]